MGTFFDFLDITKFALLIKNHPEIFFQLTVKKPPQQSDHRRWNWYVGVEVCPPPFQFLFSNIDIAYIVIGN